MRATGSLVLDVVARLALVQSVIDDVDQLVRRLVEIDVDLGSVLDVDQLIILTIGIFFAQDPERSGRFVAFSEEIFDLRLVDLVHGHVHLWRARLVDFLLLFIEFNLMQVKVLNQAVVFPGASRHRVSLACARLPVADE